MSSSATTSSSGLPLPAGSMDTDNAEGFLAVGPITAAAASSTAATRAVVDFFKSFATPTRLAVSASQQREGSEAGGNDGSGAVLIGVPTPRHIARAEMAFSPLVFKDFLDRLRVDAAADLSRRMLANIKRLGDFAIFKAEERDSAREKRGGNSSHLADGGEDSGEDNPYFACLEPDTTEKEVSVAFRRLVNHTLKQCLAHPLWAELEPAAPLEDDADGDDRRSAAMMVVTTCETREALVECIEKLVAVKCYDQIMGRCFVRGSAGIDKEADVDLDDAFDAHCEALAGEYKDLAKANADSPAALAATAEKIGVPPSLLHAAFAEQQTPTSTATSTEGESSSSSALLSPSTSSVFSGWAQVQQELGERLSSFQCPRDKLLSICNACRLLLGLLSACRERASLRHEIGKRSNNRAKKNKNNTNGSSGTGEDMGASTPVKVKTTGGSSDGSSGDEGEAATPLASPGTLFLSSLPTADDLLPALVLAVIAVRPKGLLRQLRYIRSLRSSSASSDDAAGETTSGGDHHESGNSHSHMGGGSSLRSEAGYFLTALESAAVVVSGMQLKQQEQQQPGAAAGASATPHKAGKSGGGGSDKASHRKQPKPSIAEALVPPPPPAVTAASASSSSSSATNAAALRDRQIFDAWYQERLKALPTTSNSAAPIDPKDLTAEQASKLVTEYRCLLETVRNFEALVFERRNIAGGASTAGGHK